MADLQATSKSYVEYDDVFKHVNPFSSYQKKVVFGTCMILVAQNIQFSHLVFVTGTPNFECATPNVTCGGVNRCCANCTTYKFDTMFTTMVSEWNLICDRAHITAIIQSMFFVGMLVGSFLSGIVSDAYGRRTVIFCTFGVMAACGIFQSFVDSKSFFGLLRFGSGAFMISTTLSHFILMLEFIGPEYRTMAGNANNFFWAAGTYTSILIAYFIREWRTFVWVTSVPPFILYFFWKVFPESPRWLLAHGKLEKAHQLIMKFGSINDDKELDAEVMKSMVEEIRNDQLQREKDEQKKHTPLDLLRTPKLRKWSLIIGFGWFTVAMTHFAIFIYVTHLPGDIYAILATRTSLGLLATPITWYLMKSIGRRLVQVSFFTLTGVVLLLILVIPEEYKMAITWLAILGYVTSGMIWNCVYLITTELFPTVLRNTAQGTGSTFARVGGIIAPFFLMLSSLACLATSGSRLVLSQRQRTTTKIRPKIPKKMADLQAASKSYVEYDDIFKRVNPFSSYQKKVVFGTCMMLVVQGMQISHLVFVTGTPNFECATPNVTCGGVNRCCANCTTYKFDTMFSTMVSEWNLICDRAHITAIIQSMFFVGMLVGSFLSGIVSDAYGRRTVIFCTFGAMAACGIFQSFVESESFFGLLRLGSGAFMISTTLSQFILTLEFIGPEYRTMAGNANNFFWAAGSYIAILIAYFIREWRTFVWVTSVPPFILYFFWKVFPESPRWLLAHGKLEKAHQLIMKFGSINDDKELDVEVMKSMVEEIRNDQLQREKDEQKKHTPLDLLRTPKLRKWSLIIGFGWFTVAMTHFAIFIYATHLPGDIYTILATRTSLLILATPITWYLMKSIGRRLVQVSFFTLTGVVLLLILVIPEEYKMAITWLAILGNVLTAMIWSCVYLITTELFPTVLRNTAQGTGSTFARVGGIVAPFFLMLAQLPGSSIHLPMAIFGACALACGILSLWLPETALSTLHQTIKETEESQESYGMPCMRKRGRRKRQEYTLETVQENLGYFPEDKKECS